MGEFGWRTQRDPSGEPGEAVAIIQILTIENPLARAPSGDVSKEKVNRC